MEARKATETTLSRTEAIERMREKLWAATKDHECACSVTARLGVLCRGFHRLDDDRLRERYAWLGLNRLPLSRRELEGLVVAHHASRQEVRHAAVCCDVESRERGGYEGWEMFDDRALERDLRALTGHPVSIR